MKFKQYLTEANIEYYYNNIRKDCKKYLNAVKNTDNLLIRYEDKVIESYKKRVRKNRRPKDTPLAVHKFVDKALKEKFGWKVRSSGLFCYSTNSHSAGYFVFPIGKFEYVYSTRVDDLTVF